MKSPVIVSHLHSFSKTNDVLIDYGARRRHRHHEVYPASQSNEALGEWCNQPITNQRIIRQACDDSMRLNLASLLAAAPPEGAVNLRPLAADTSSFDLRIDTAPCDITADPTYPFLPQYSKLSRPVRPECWGVHSSLSCRSGDYARRTAHSLSIQNVISFDESFQPFDPGFVY